MEYAFDLTLASTIRVKANSAAEAVALLKQNLDAADCNMGAWPDGSPILAECSIIGDPSLFEVDGNDPSTPPPGTAFDFLSNVALAALVAWDNEEESVKAEHAEHIAQLRATLTALGCLK